jgi:hypothetical protein
MHEDSHPVANLHRIAIVLKSAERKQQHLVHWSKSYPPIFMEGNKSAIPDKRLLNPLVEMETVNWIQTCLFLWVFFGFIQSLWLQAVHHIILVIMCNDEFFNLLELFAWRICFRIQNNANKLPSHQSLHVYRWGQV